MEENPFIARAASSTISSMNPAPKAARPSLSCTRPTVTQLSAWHLPAADAVEFRTANPSDPTGVELDTKPGRWLPSPVEYKRGKPKKQICDLVQVLRHSSKNAWKRMFGTAIPADALFSATPCRRQAVAFTPELRAQTERLCARMQDLYRRSETPPPVYTKGCENCSLKNVSAPRSLSCWLRRWRGVRAHLAEAMKE